MQLNSRKVRRTIQELESLIAGTGLPRSASDYVADYQQKCQVSRQAAIDSIYRMFESVLPDKARSEEPGPN